MNRVHSAADAPSFPSSHQTRHSSHYHHHQQQLPSSPRRTLNGNSRNIAPKSSQMSPHSSPARSPRREHRRSPYGSSYVLPNGSPNEIGHAPFHYNDTQPPHGSRRSGSSRNAPQHFRDFSDDEEYKTPVVRRLDNNVQGGSRRLRLRVRVEGVRDLVPMTRSPPSTFVTVRTSYGRGKTPVIRNDASPPFNDEFFFDIVNPEREEVEFTVVAVTNNGRKKIGQCVLSLKNILRGVEWRAWVGLIRHSGTERAYERGDILISLYTNSFGARAVPPVEAENEFRENMRQLLSENAAEELHRLEWYVGEYMNDYTGAYSALCQQFQRPRGRPATFQLTIKNVLNLTEENGTPTPRETCFVRVTADGVKKTTRVIPYHREAIFNEVLDLKLLNSLTGTISLEVFSSNYKFGECLISLAGLRCGVPKERTHAIVHAAGTGDACYCGFITVILCSHSFDSDTTEIEESEKAKRLRLQNYLWTYLRDDLHRLDPIAGSVDDIDRFMREWTQTYGPEPQQHLLKIGFKALRCSSKVRARAYAVIVRLGPEVFRTKNVRGDKELKFNDETELNVCSPLNSEFTFIVVNEEDGTDIEVARSVISLNDLPLGKRKQRTLRLFQKALTADATLYGALTIELEACNFDTTGESSLSNDKEKYFIERVEALLSRYDPAQLHRTGFLLGEYAGKEEELMKHLVSTYGPETGAAPMRIRVIGIRHFTLTCPCYVKVYLDGSPALCTKDHFPAKEIKFDIDMKNEVVVSLKNPQRSIVTFKVGEHRWLRSRVLGRASMSLRNMVRGEPNVCWISFFADGGSDEVGQIGVELQSIGFAKGTVTLYTKLRGFTVNNTDALGLVTKDATSLLRKYNSEELPNVHALIGKATSLKDAHAELRKRFALRTIILTFYINIQKVEMYHDSDKDAAIKGLLVVGASCAGDLVSSSMRTAFADSIDTYKYYPDIRIDIPVPTEPIDASASLPLEIILNEKLVPVNPANNVKKNTLDHITVSEREVGRATLSLRSLLTPKVYHLGEPLTVPIVRTNDNTGTSRASRFLPAPNRDIIVGEITLNITLPVFEVVPRWLRFSSQVMQRFNREYVRYYQKRIGDVLRSHDPMQLREFQFTLYERDVASGRWPLSLYDWLMALMKLYGPEKGSLLGPPPRLPFDPESEEMERTGDGYAVRATTFHSSSGRSSTTTPIRLSHRPHTK